MADDIALNRAQRTTLFSLQQIERDSSVSQRRLSFGRKIVDVTDGATQFFQARSLSSRISDTRERGEQVDQAISALQTFVGGAQSLQSYLDIARGHVLRAESLLANPNGASREGITTAFNEALRNFYEAAQSLQYNGLNLLVNQDREFSVRFSDRASDQLQVSGRNLFGTGAYTLDKGNLFGRTVIDENGVIDFANTQLNLDEADATNKIVIRGEVATGAAALVANADGEIAVGGAVTFRAGAVVSVGDGTAARINGAVSGGNPAFTDIGADLTYRNVDRVTFTTVTGQDVVDNGDGSYTISGVTASTLEIGAGAGSGVTGTATQAEVGGFSDVTTTRSAVLDEVRAIIDLAKDRLETIESYFGSNVALLQERLSFGITYGNNLTIGRDKIVLADVNSEAAVLTTLRTRNQIGIGALASNAESEQQLLRLLS